jgi:hypothetical protein
MPLHGHRRPDDIACFPNIGKARMRGTGKTLPISSL